MVKKKTRPVILITNDDDITSKGIRSLVEAVSDLAKVVVVAPDKPQSGMGHAITIGSPLRMNLVNFFNGIEAWQRNRAGAVSYKKNEKRFHEPLTSNTRVF